MSRFVTASTISSSVVSFSFKCHIENNFGPGLYLEKHRVEASGEVDGSFGQVL